MTPPASSAIAPGRQRAWALRFLFPAFLVVYYVVGVTRMGKTEWYPFASWAMFSTVPNKVTTYRLRVTSVGARSISPPAYYGKAEGVFTAPVRISSVSAIYRFGRSLRIHDDRIAVQYRKLVEHTLLPPEASYDVVEQHYWPIEKWLHNRYDETVVASFHSNPGEE